MEDFDWNMEILGFWLGFMSLVWIGLGVKNDWSFGILEFCGKLQVVIRELNLGELGDKRIFFVVLGFKFWFISD